MQITLRTQRGSRPRKKRLPAPRRFASAGLLFAVCVLLGGAVRRAAGDELPFRLETGGHTNRVMGLMFVSLPGIGNAPGEERLVSAGVDQTVRVWSPETASITLTEGTPRVATFRYNSDDSGKGEIWSAAYDSVHRWIALGCKARPGGAKNENFAEILLIDSEGNIVHPPLRDCRDNIRALAFSPKGDYLAVCSQDRVLVYDTTSWKAVQMDAKFFGGCAAFDPAGEHLAVGGENDAVRFYDMRSKKKLQEVRHINDGKQDGKQDVLSLAWAKTGYLAAGDAEGGVYGWESGQKKFVPLRAGQPNGLPVSCLAFDGDSKFLAVGLSGQLPHPGQIEILDVANGNPLRSPLETRNPVTSLAFSHDGKTLASGDAAGIIQMWNWRSAAQSESMKDLAGSGRSIYYLAWTRDNSTLAWSVDGRSSQPMMGFNLKAMCLGTLSGDTAFAPSTVTLQIADKKASLTRPTGSFTLQIESADTTNAEIALGVQNTVPIQRAFYDEPHSMAYLVTNAPAIVRSYDVSDPKNPRLAGFYGGYSGTVNTLSVSPNGKYLAVGTADQVVRVWSLADPAQKAAAEHPARPLISLFVGQDQEWVAWNQETGFYAASAQGDYIINYQLNDPADTRPAVVVPVSICRDPFYNPLCMAQLFQSATAQTVYDLKNTLPDKASVEQRIQRRPIIEEIEVREAAQTEALKKDLAQDRFITTKDQVILRVPIKGEGTVARARLRVLNTNTGRTIRGEYAPASPASVPALQEGDLVVPLQPGLNTLRIVAVSQDGKINSQPYSLQMEYRGASIKKGVLRVLAIGPSSYPFLPDNQKLHFADKDAEAIGELFKKQKGLENGLYTDVKVKVLANADASREHVRDELAALKVASQPEDTLVFFLAGHGQPPSDVNVKNPDYYFIPNDFKYDIDPDNMEKKALSWKYIIGELTEVKAVHKFLFIDHCFAGGVDGLVNNEQNAVTTRAATQASRDLSEGAFITFMASAANEKSREHAQWGHGAFTRALLDILSGTDFKLRNGKDRVVTVIDIQYVIGDKVRALLNSVPELKDVSQQPSLQKSVQNSNILDLPIVKLLP